MSVCKNCCYIGGYHAPWCPAPHVATQYVVTTTNTTKVTA